MAIRPEALPTDAAALTEMVLALDAENEKLRVAMQTLKEMIFGKRSERLAVIVAEQLALELDDLATGVTPPAPANDDVPATKPAGKPRKRARRNIGALPKHLPRCEQVLEPDATACPCCQGVLHRIGEDVSEVLDVIPAILRVLRTIRPKYACRGCTDGVVQAKVLPRLIEGGMASTALVTHVVVSKFAWYLPLYRQVQILAGQGIHLDRATLAGWVKRAAWWLKSLYELQLKSIQASPRLFCDETPMPVLDPGRHRTRICQFWAHAMDDRPWGGPSPPAVAYVFADGRGTKEIAGQLTGFSGILQVDGYAAYKALARGQGGAIQLAFCLAHARRKLVEVYKTMQSPFAHEVIERLQAVYAIEAEIRGSSAEQRLAVRRTRTAPLMEELKARLAKLTKRIVDAAEARDKDHVIWEDELLGFGLRVFTSGKRSYLIQYRSVGRSRRYTIGQHGVWTPELARKEAKVQLGRVAKGDNPAEERQLDHKAITVKELCDLYLNDLKASLILGKAGARGRQRRSQSTQAVYTVISCR
jgi:transposase